MIRSFGDRLTEAVFHGERTREAGRISFELTRRIVRKLDMLNSAANLQDLRSPPGNRLEALRGDLSGWFSIRVNQQWRLVFRWNHNDVWDVTLIDYHD